MALVVGVLIVGYLYQRSAEEVVHTPTGKPTTELVEDQVKGILDQYQQKLDKQAQEQ